MECQQKFMSVKLFRALYKDDDRFPVINSVSSLNARLQMKSHKVYIAGVGMSKFIKPRGLVDYPGKHALIRQ